jgi:hypothetical protein
MLSALLMFRRVAHALRYAVRGQDFLTVFGAGMTLVFIGTLYFAVATLTITSVSDPDLVLDKPWIKLFTVFCILIGIGILVEILRRLGIAFVAVRAQERASANRRRLSPRRLRRRTDRTNLGRGGRPRPSRRGGSARRCR